MSGSQHSTKPGDLSQVAQIDSASFYAFDHEDARSYDEELPQGEQHFARMLPGGNSLLLAYEDFEPSDYPDIDPGDLEPGCEVVFAPALSQEHRQHIASRLAALGYAVSRFPERLLVSQWHRDTVTEAVTRDISEILADKERSAS